MLTAFTILKSLERPTSSPCSLTPPLLQRGSWLGDQEEWGERGWRGSGVEGGNGPGVEEIEFAAKYKSQLPTPTLGREERAFPTPENTLPPTQ